MVEQLSAVGGGHRPGYRGHQASAAVTIATCTGSIIIIIIKQQQHLQARESKLMNADSEKFLQQKNLYTNENKLLS